jgi:hypothetical protein
MIGIKTSRLFLFHSVFILFSHFLHLNNIQFIQSLSYFSILDMSSSDDSSSISRMVVGSHSSLDPLDDDISNPPEDEENNDEPQLDDDYQELTPVLSICNSIPTINATFSVKNIHI